LSIRDRNLIVEEEVRATIIAGGDAHEEDGRRWVAGGGLIIGADGGAAQALAWGLVPDLVIGDLDSLSKADQARLEQLGCRFLVHPRSKDETDLELALTEAVAEGAREITILGALGGRLDHTLANLLLLTLPALEGVATRLVAGDLEVRLVRGGESVCLHGQPRDLVSLLPLGGEARGVTTAGLTWPLQAETLHFGYTRGISNEMTAAEACIGVAQGILLLVHAPAPQSQNLRPGECG